MTSDENCPSCRESHTLPRAMHLTESQVNDAQRLLDSVSVRAYRPAQETAVMNDATVGNDAGFELKYDLSDQADDGVIIQPRTPHETPPAGHDLTFETDFEQPFAQDFSSEDFDEPSISDPPLETPPADVPPVGVPPAPTMHFMNDNPSVEGNSVGLRVESNLLQFQHTPAQPLEKKDVKNSKGKTLGLLEIYDHSIPGKPKGYRLRYKGSAGSAEKCKWIQFYRQCYSCKKNWTETIDKKKVTKEEWVEVGKDNTNVTGGNGGKRVKIDCETWYVDSADANGKNEPGYVEGSGFANGKSGVEGDSGKKDVAEMKDAPGYKETPAGGSVADRIAKDFKNYRDGQKGKIQPKGAEYTSFKLRMDFTAYLVCDGQVRAKITWWYEFIERDGKFESRKGLTENDPQAQGMEDVHVRALHDFEKGGRNGAK